MRTIACKERGGRVSSLRTYVKKPLYLKGTLTKNGLLKTIANLIKHVNFQLYRAHPDGIILEKTDN